MWPFSKRRPRRPRPAWDLSTPILALSNSDYWSIGDACQGTQIFGSTGSGKSTGPLAAICRAFLRAGFGGLFLTAKETDRRVYESYCREAGRQGDVLVFGPNEPLRYNALDAELRRRDAAAGLTETIVALLSTLVEISERNSGQGEREESGYWKRTNLQLMRNAVELLVLAKGRINVPELYKLIVSAPTSNAQLHSEEWQRGSFCWECLVEADRKPKTPRQRADYELVTVYFCVEWANLSERTRTVVLSTFTSMLDVLNRGIVRDLMGDGTNVTPEMAQNGAIFIIDLPLMVFGQIGVFIQVLWKYCFMKAQERRDTAANPRPTFIVVDESHLVAVSQDQVFQTTARSTRTAVVYATQSISNYLAVFGEHADAQVHSLMGNLQTQVFCQQADIRTNAYAAELIGRSRQYLVNANSNYQPDDWFSSMLGTRAGNNSAGVSECFEYEVQPNHFARLRKGGPPEWIVDSLVYQGGRRFGATGRPWLPVSFGQHLPAGR